MESFGLQEGPPGPGGKRKRRTQGHNTEAGTAQACTNSVAKEVAQFGIPSTRSSPRLAFLLAQHPPSPTDLSPKSVSPPPILCASSGSEY
ncbi:hypothetical protein CSPAE12_07160 [Colletotrichum incanum]|nr:hypothetical protein CSPAE12_07160 [Colletotrichum incanum]